jgi:hypothetical protein
LAFFVVIIIIVITIVLRALSHRQLDEDRLHVVHTSRASAAVLTTQQRLALLLTHLFTPILFYYDVALRTLYQNAGKIAVSKLLKEKVFAYLVLVAFFLPWIHY